MDHFTPISALAGGAMIGAAAALLLLLNGRVAGVSGVIGGLAASVDGDTGWRLAFLAGLISAPVAVMIFGGDAPMVSVGASPLAIVAGGLLVGFGSRLGSGCTSGHGVCGLSRGSGRSLVATAVFMSTAVATVALAQRLAGADMRLVSAFACGLLFGLGLVVSQMIDPAKVLGFLDVFGRWDPSLAFVMAGALITSALGYRIARARGAPAFAARLEIPGRSDIDRRLVLGAVLFGAGWGLVGFCPGPALAALSVGGGATALFVAAMLAGMALFRLLPEAMQDARPAADDA